MVYHNSDIDDCVGVTCQHNGTCKDDVNSYTCNCAEDFEGLFCETGIRYNVSCK